MINQKRNEKGQFVKGYPSWNTGTKGLMNTWCKGLKGIHLSPKSEFKKGRITSEEHRKNLSIAGMGRKFSEETRKKIGDAHRGEKNYLFGKKHSLETRAKMRIACLGEKAPAWKGGVTPFHLSLRGSLKYKVWREAVFKRDNFICQDCGDDRGGNLNADHIKSFAVILNENKIKSAEDAINCSELWDVNNGRTLCVPCHKKTPTFGYTKLIRDLLFKSPNLVVT